MILTPVDTPPEGRDENTLWKRKRLGKFDRLLTLSLSTVCMLSVSVYTKCPYYTHMIRMLKFKVV